MDIATVRRKHRLNLLPTPADDPTLPDPILTFEAIRQYLPTSTESKKGKGKAAARAVDCPTVAVAAEVLEKVLSNLAAMGWRTPTPVQMQAVPLMLADRDVLSHAPTGSGKTLAFFFPVLLSLPQSSKTAEPSKPRALIVEPTRELARQVCSVGRAIAGDIGWKIAVLGEEDEPSDLSDEEAAPPPAAKERKKALRKRKRTGAAHKPNAIPGLPECEVLIATPLKLLWHLNEHPDSLSALSHLILDEADYLLSSHTSFLQQTDSILAALPSPPHRVQKGLFTATLSSSVEQLARTFLKEGCTVRLLVGLKDTGASTLIQRLDFVNTEASKLPHVQQLIQQGSLPPPVLLFCQSPDRARDLANLLSREGLRADHVSGDRRKEERDAVVERFARGEVWYLCATDVFARGLDFRMVKTVVNYDFPQSATDYVHRIGRAGRNGFPGTAVTLFTTADGAFLRLIVNIMRNGGCEVPEWMLGLKNVGKNTRKKLRTRPVKREGIKEAVGLMVGKKKRKLGQVKGKNGDEQEEWQPARAFDGSDGDEDECQPAATDEDEGWQSASAFNS